MLGYNIYIALKSIRRNPLLSMLIIGAIALGIAVSTAFTTVYHVLAKDPIPAKRNMLHYVRMDSWDPRRPYPGDIPGPPPQVTYRDMVEIMKSDIPVHQGGSFATNLYVYPDPKVGRPYQANIRLCFADFFPMFEVPFKYGGAWDKAADRGPEQVVVIDAETNQKVFGGRNSVGETIRIEERDYKVVGVMDRWRPTIKYFDPTQGPFNPIESIFMPFNFLEPLQLRTSGNSDGWQDTIEPGFKGFLASDVCWIQMWVELKDEKAKAAYTDFLAAYVTDQKKHGRFGRPMDNRVNTLSEIQDEFGTIPPQVKALASISLLFLVVCSLNLVGLLLGKFLARAPEVGVRRALGASRIAVFIQHIVECELVGAVGGVIGIVASLGIIALIRSAAPPGAEFNMDTQMVVSALFLSLGAGLIAGLYPAWRICSTPPAIHLKLQ